MPNPPWGFRSRLSYELLPPPKLKHPILQFFMAPLRMRRLLKPLKYLEKDGTTNTVPADFRSNLGNIPRILWAFFPPFGLNEEPFWLHDYWCVHKTGQRRKADYLLREAIEAQQLLILPHPAEQPNSLSRIWTALVMIVAVLMFLIQRWAIWSAVRLFAIIARKK